MFGPCFVMKYIVTFLFCNPFDVYWWYVCFTLIIFFIVSCDCQCVWLLFGCRGWVSDCGVPLSHSLNF